MGQCRLTCWFALFSVIVSLMGSVLRRARRSPRARKAFHRLRTRLRESSEGTPAPTGNARHLSPRPVDSADVHALRALSEREILDALAPVPAILAPFTPRFARHIAVRRDDLSAVRASLQRLGGSWEQRLTSSGSMRLRPLYTCRGVPIVLGKELDLIIDVMDREGDAYVSRSMGSLSRIPAAQWESIAQETAAEKGRPAPNIQGPIDVVFTWVDGRDPQWRARRDAAARAVNAAELHPTSMDDARFEDSEELRYALRSLHQFAGWVRRIFIVTDQQVPAWLNTDDPRIQIVDHSEILDGSRFNSHAIEAALHRIPGLSEHYLYMNDDTFLGRTVFPEDFYASDSVARFFPSDLPIDPGPVGNQELPLMAAAKNGRDLLAQRFGIQVRSKMRHTVHPQLRSVAQRIEEENPEAVQRTRDALFRSFTDLSIASSLQGWYSWALGTAAPAVANYLYIDILDPDLGYRLDVLVASRRYDMFCLNQESSGERSVSARREMLEFMKNYYPHRAPWEIER